MTMGIFSFLRKQGLTTLKIRYDYKTGKIRYFAFREWEEDCDFSRYNKDFVAGSFLSDCNKFYGQEELDEKLVGGGVAEYFQDFLRLMRENRYFGVDFYYHEKLGIKVMAFDHNRTKGINSKTWGKTLGGIRRHPPEKKEWEVLADGIKLGAAMTYKSAALDLPAGGSKLLAWMREPNLQNDQILGFFAYVADRSQVITTPDMNLPIEMSDRVKEMGYSKLFVGGKEAAVGKPGDATALGILLSMKAAVEFKEGKKEFPLEGKRIVLMGHGSVGRPLVKHLLKEKAEVILAVRDPSSAPKGVKAVPYDEGVFQDGDILCPCGSGGVIKEEDIPCLKFSYIWGAANNQLMARTREDEYRLAKKIQERGILYQAEWWHNGGGILCMAEEYFYDGTKDSLEAKLHKIIPQKTLDVLGEAEREGLTPTEVCYRKCEEAVYPTEE
ncbi:MAG: Glu/Leu/Phe/Val dehydrogenase dimerization domain-containing protein [Anaerovoracaceae bacterium]|jgi:glutamate dehydrogenase/leucine dehydrogenase